MMTATEAWRRPRVWLLAVLLVVLGGVAITGPAQADAPIRQGWWSVTGPTLVAPDVPADGLAVQGSADNPDAVAALVYPVADDLLAATLTLTVAPQSGTVPGSVIKACVLTKVAFVPAQGGALAEAPAWDCNDFVTGSADATRSNYVFSVGPLVRNGHLAIALVGNSVSDRAVFARPDVSSLTVTSPDPPGGPAPSSNEPSPAPAPDVPPPFRSLDPPLLPAPAPPVPPITAPVPQLGPLSPTIDDTPVAPSAPAITAAALSSPSASGDGALLMVLLLTALALAGAVQRYRVLQDQVPPS